MAIAARTVWRVRTGGDDNNGAGYDSTVASAGTDYSQQDVAQLTITATLSAGGTTTLTDAAGGNQFTSAMVANVIRISGGTLTAGWYCIMAFTDANNVVLDRTPGTGTLSTGRVGGGWATTANLASTGPMVGGNTWYLRGNNGGTPSDNPTNIDYTTNFIDTAVGSAAAGYIRGIGENGRPLISCSQNTVFDDCRYASFENLYFKCANATFPTEGMIDGASGPTLIINCAFDQNGKDVACVTSAVNSPIIMVGCEIWDSTGGTAGARYGVQLLDVGSVLIGNNIHNCKGGGMSSAQVGALINNIFSKNNGNGWNPTGTGVATAGAIIGNTFDANTGEQINVASPATLQAIAALGNIISNAPTGKYGIITTGTLAVNDRIKGLWDFNWLYNPVDSPDKDYSLISAGPHDTQASDPLYTDQTTADYTLQSTSPAIAKGFPTPASPSLPIGASPAIFTTIQQYLLRRSTTPNVRSYPDAGAVQRVMGSSGGSSVAIPIGGRIAP